MNIQFIAIGNDELGDWLIEKTSIKCELCGKLHPIEQSEPSTIYHSDGTTSKGKPGLLQFYKCDGKSYLIGLNNRRVNKQ
jgi:hypothetical protein